MAALNDPGALPKRSASGDVRGKFSWSPADRHIQLAFQTWHDTEARERSNKESAMNICAADVYQKWGKSLLVKDKKTEELRAITEDECRQVSFFLGTASL